LREGAAASAIDVLNETAMRRREPVRLPERPRPMLVRQPGYIVLSLESRQRIRGARVSTKRPCALESVAGVW
jgi:hypothetical protein